MRLIIWKRRTKLHGCSSVVLGCHCTNTPMRRSPARCWRWDRRTRHCGRAAVTGNGLRPDELGDGCACREPPVSRDQRRPKLLGQFHIDGVNQPKDLASCPRAENDMWKLMALDRRIHECFEPGPHLLHGEPTVAVESTKGGQNLGVEVCGRVHVLTAEPSGHCHPSLVTEKEVNDRRGVDHDGPAHHPRSDRAASMASTASLCSTEVRGRALTRSSQSSERWSVSSCRSARWATLETLRPAARASSMSSSGRYTLTRAMRTSYTPRRR